jgi:hypothetical protein
MKKLFSFGLLCISISLFTACEEDEKRPDLVIPTAYEATNYATNAATQRAVVSQLVSLTDEAKKGRVSGATVTKTALDNLFTAGSPSLQAVITSYFKGKLEGTNGWFDELAKASGGTYTPSATITGNGGVYGTGSSAYLFDENGLEIEQLVEKGQFGATHYNHAIALITGTIDATTADKLLAIFGATPSFPNSGSNNVAADIRDRATANYAARRDKNDGNGFYSQLKIQFIKLQAALKAGSEYNQERDEAIAEIKLLWEKVNFATVINYCHTVITTMSATTLTDNQKASALHSYGECVGFTHGWRTIAQAHKKITDTQIDEILTLLNAPQNGTATSYKFITDPVNELPKLTQIINKLKDLYGFTTQEIEDFKSNWVSIQGR